MTQKNTLERWDEVNLKRAWKPRKIVFSIEHEQQEASKFYWKCKGFLFYILGFKSSLGISTWHWKQNPPVAKGSSLQSLSCWILL